MLIRATLIALSLFSIGLVGCGKKASPKPPEASAPSPVVALTVVADTKGVVLSWERPLSTASGDDLVNLSQFIVRRAELRGGTTPSFDDIAEISAGANVVVGESTSTGGDTTQSVVSFRYEDLQVEHGKRYIYQVVPVNDYDVEGLPGRLVRVSFLGAESVVEN